MLAGLLGPPGLLLFRSLSLCLCDLLLCLCLLLLLSLVLLLFSLWMIVLMSGVVLALCLLISCLFLMVTNFGFVISGRVMIIMSYFVVLSSASVRPIGCVPVGRLRRSVCLLVPVPLSMMILFGVISLLCFFLVRSFCFGRLLTFARVFCWFLLLGLCVLGGHLVGLFS